MGIPSVLHTPRSKKIALAAGALFVIFGFLGFLVAPHFVKPALESALAEKLHRTVAIRELNINPYALSATVKGLVINERDGTDHALAIDELYVNLEAESLFRQAPVVGELRLLAPSVKVVRKADKGYNFSDLIDEFLNTPASDPPARFSINNIQIAEGRIDFNDVPMGKQHTVDNIRVGVPFVSNLPSMVDIHVQPAFSAKLNGAPVAIGGELLPFSANREASVKLNLDGLSLPKYLDYSPVPLPFKLPAGILDTKLIATFKMPKDKAMSLDIAGTAALENFELLDTAGRPLAKWPALNVAIRSLDVFGNKLAVDSVRLDRPELTLARDGRGILNLASLIPQQPAKAAGKAKADAPAQPSRPFEFSIAEIRLADGRIGLADDFPKRPFHARLEEINLTVRQLSSGKDPATVELALKSDSGERIEQHAQVTLAPFSARGDISVTALQLKNYAPYFAPFVRFNLEDGSLDASAAYSLAANDGQFQAQVNDGKAALTGLKLRQPDDKRPFFTLDQIQVQGVTVDLGKREIAIGDLRTAGGKLLAKRDKAGVFNLSQLVPDSPGARQAGHAATGATPWQVSLAKLAVDGYGVRIEDQKVPGSLPFVAEPIALAAENLSTTGKAPSKLALKVAIGKRGKLDLAGTLAPQPLQARFKLDLQRVDLVPLQPYFQDKLNVTVTKGAASARGVLAASQTRGGEINASYRGDANLSDVAMIDNPTASDLLKWKSLYVSGVEFDLLPLKVSIASISLSDFYSRVILSPEGKLNLAQIVADSGAPAATAAPPSPPPSVKIGKVTLQGGNVRFTDNFIKPNYTANMVNIGGAVAGLSSEAGTTADVDLRGDLNNAPLQIAGKVNPLASEIQLDLKAGVRGMELAPLSPYSGKYAGYAIEKGKLTVDVRYFIENRKLQAENHLFLDQLTFGERVESPDATKMPVMLAVALLKNRRGEIDINLPVSGSLDDPQFSVGGIVVQVIVNLVVKAVTSPFALLGSMFGGGEDLAYIEFEPGRADIGPAAETKLKALAKALDDRPALKIDIAGRIDPATDAEGMRRVQMERKVKAQKLRETVKKGEDAGSVAEVAVSSEEYAKYLKQAYKDEKFAKPRNLIGFAKDLPPEEMEKLMLANAQVGNEDLRALADQRALAIKEWILKKGGIPAERVFIVASKLSAEEIKDKGKASRVDLSLK